MAKEKKKHSNQVNPQVSPESLGSRTQATATCEEAIAPTPPTKGLLPSPSKVSDEYLSKYWLPILSLCWTAL